MIDPAIRREFPLLERRINGRPIVYLDSASTSLKPRCVLEAIRRYYEESTANVHRSTHHLGEETTIAYEGARDRIARFINARPDEIVFVRNATEAINLVALGGAWQADDEIVITPLEHHSNQLPWVTRVRTLYVPLGENGLPDSSRLDSLLSARTRMLGVGLVSNVTGTETDLAPWCDAARSRGIPLMVDAAQAAGHRPIDVQKLGCDFLAFSGHKTLGPSGIGVLWGKRELLEQLKPSLFGGGMVSASRLEDYSLKEIPWCFEAGTPNIEGALGMASAIEFLSRLTMEAVREHSLSLGRRLFDGLSELPRLRLIAADSRERFGIAGFSIDVDGLSVEAFGRLMADSHGIMLSAGRHCTHPYHDMLDLVATVRASTHVYTTEDEIDQFLAAVGDILGPGKAS